MINNGRTGAQTLTISILLGLAILIASTLLAIVGLGGAERVDSEHFAGYWQAGWGKTSR